MQVFNLYFKLLRQSSRSIVLYIVLFMSVFMAFTIYYQNGVSSSGYEAVKVKVAISDQDASALSREVTAFISDTMDVVELDPSEEAQKDALFFDQVAYIITVPAGFEEQFQDGAKLITQQKPDSADGFLAENHLNSFLNSIRIYMEQEPTLSVEEAGKLVREDLDTHAEVSLSETSAPLNEAKEFEKSMKTVYFNYLTYMFMAIIILSVGMIMTKFNQKEIRMRNIVSPLKTSSYNLQLLAGNLCFCSGIWLLFMVMIICISPSILSPAAMLYFLNSFVFMMVCLGLAYLISALFSNLTHADDALNGVANIISLGSSFLCGAFVPQAVLSQSVLMAASFTPAYWYVRFNNEAQNVTSFVWEQISGLCGYLGIQLLFAVTFIILAVVITKSKRSTQEL